MRNSFNSHCHNVPLDAPTHAGNRLVRISSVKVSSFDLTLYRAHLLKSPLNHLTVQIPPQRQRDPPPLRLHHARNGSTAGRSLRRLGVNELPIQAHVIVPKLDLSESLEMLPLHLHPFLVPIQIQVQGRHEGRT